MRESEYKGKSIEDNQWVFGNLLHDGKRAYIVSEFEVNNDHGDGLRLNATCFREVYPDSVGKYTGLKVGKGVKAYERDIAQITHSDGQQEYEEISEIVWNEEHGNFSPWSWEYECEGCDLYVEIIEIKIIGNAYDNPELVNN